MAQRPARLRQVFTHIKTLHFLRFLFPGVVLMTLGLTTSAYLLIDLLPIQSLSPLKDIQVRIITQVWYALVWMFYSVSMSFLIYHQLGKKQGLTQSSFLDFVALHFAEYITAQLRILIHVSLWFLALILPGFVMEARFRLASLFIFFHPRFHQDRSLDPLRLSLDAIPLKKVGFIGVILVLTTITPMVVDSVYAHASLMFEPQGRVAQILIYTLLNLITHSYIFKTYLDMTEGKEYV